MRVVYLTPSAALGGAERSLLDAILAVRAARPGLEPTLLLGEEGPLLEAAQAQGVAHRLVPFPAALAGVGDSALRESGAGARRALLRRAPRAAAGALRYARDLRRAVAELGPDLIHSNTLKTHLLTPALGARVPVLWHLRDYLSQRPLVSRLLRPAARAAAAGVAISRSLAEDARGVLPRLPIEVVYNAIDLAAFDASGPALELEAAPGAVRIGLVATYGRWKGHDLFLEALSRLDPALPWRAYLIGGAIYRTAGSQWSREELEARARALGVAERVGFVDFVSDPAQAFRALDVVVHASTRPEPFGRTIVEAMACGRAVVAARAGGAAELFRHEVEAVGVPPCDPVALADALRGLVLDPGRRAALGAAGHAAAHERFGRARLGEDLARVYARLVTHWSES
ncbi:MAG: glycosyltransferase [Planctomycetota bacterium]